MTSRHIQLALLLTAAALIAGCDAVSGPIRAIAREEARAEARKMLAGYQASLEPETFGFGVPWEKDFSYAQGVRVGSTIYVAGQLSHSPVSDGTWSYDKATVGEDFETQYRRTLENVKTVLAHFGATMDDVVFLQNFFDPVAGGVEIGDYGPVVRRLINEYFPNARHAMTNMQVTNLFGENQFVETNAIAVIGRQAATAKSDR